MKILHCCLAAFYIDNYGYQENILPKIHKQQGHEVRIIASTETYMNNGHLGYTNAKSYYTEDEIPITRLAYVSWLPPILQHKLRIYKGLKKQLQEFHPDILFLHDVQFLSVKDILSYVKKEKTIIFADSHTDNINSGRTWFSKNILHKLIYKFCVKQIEPYVTKFYGTLPKRVEFLNNIYGVKKDKISFLPMGVNDSMIDFSKKEEIRNSIRKNLGIKNSDFVIISGGKIGKEKNTHLLINAIKQLPPDKYNVKLLLFGKILPEMKNEILSLIKDDNNIIYIEWLPAKDIYKYLFSADLACFPGTHSTLWEEAVGTGTPCIFKKWEGITHVDRGGNCILLPNINTITLKESILEIVLNKNKYNEMRNIATSESVLKYFSYSDIAKRAIKI